MDRTIMTYEEMLAKVGGYGRCQFYIQMLYTLTNTLDYATLLSMYFGGLSSSWICEQNSTICRFNHTLPSEDTLRCQLPRKAWSYTEADEYSIVTEFEADCDKTWAVDLSMSIAFLGIMIGGIVNGYLSDRFGRQTLVLPNVVVAVSFGGLSGISPNLPFLLACRFMTGFATTVPIIYPHLNEMVESKHRAFASQFLAFGAMLACCLVSITSYYTQNWRHVFLCLTLPFIVLLPFIYIIPESPRFYIAKGKKEAAIKTLRKLALWNKFDWIDSWDLKVAEKPNHSNPCDLVSSVSMCKRTAFLILSLTSTGLSYFSLSLGASEFNVNVYFSFALLAIIDAPGIVWGAYSSNRFGRKSTVNTSGLCCGICFILLLLLPRSTPSLHILHFSVGMCGKFLAIVYSMSMVSWASELFPTNLRGQACGIGQVSNKGGALLAPLLLNHGKLVHNSFPFLCVGFMCLFSSFIGCSMPETNGKPLQDFNDRNSDVPAGIRNSDHEILIPEQN